MTGKVKTGQQARVAATEARILAAAGDLFVRDGYHRTTLTSVAEAAGVGHRTVYVRFGTKSALFRRVVDVAIGGDTASVPVSEREWFRQALSAETLDERLEALVTGTAALMERAGDLFRVALEAQSTEPELAAAMQAGREATREHLHTFVRSMVGDGLLETSDAAWLAETVALVCHAETFVLLQRTAGWEIDSYRRWLRETAGRLVAS